MKLIYLDVDGVMNHWCGEKSYTEQKKWHKRHNSYYDFNHINVRWTKKFLTHAVRLGYKIVISSSWRKMPLNIVALKVVLGEDISRNIVGYTGQHRSRREHLNGREVEISESILEHTKYMATISNTIVIDDEVSPVRMKGIADVIKTSTRKGFRRKHYKLGLKIIK